MKVFIFVLIFLLVCIYEVYCTERELYNYLYLFRICLQGHQPGWTDFSSLQRRGHCRLCNPEEGPSKCSPFLKKYLLYIYIFFFFFVYLCWFYYNFSEGLFLISPSKNIISLCAWIRLFKNFGLVLLNYLVCHIKEMCP